MSGTGPNNNNNNGQMNPQNFLLQQQFAQQQQQQQGNTFPQGGFAGTNAQQQRMLQMQLQQQQMQLQKMQSKSQQQPGTRSSNSAMANNPLAPAPATLNRGNMMASNAVSAAPPLGRMNSSATSGSIKSKGGGAPKLGRASSNAIPGPPGLMKATTSSASIANSSANPNTDTSEQQTQQLLNSCDWKDRTMWVSRQLLGGNATNGFLRATATVQRIKRQRARQTAQSKKKAEAEAKGEDGTGGAPDAATVAANKEKEKAEAKKRDTPDQASEEILKKEIMNPRTAKKLKQELEAGLVYCVTLQNAIRTIIMEMDPQIAVFTPLPLSQGGEIPRSAMMASASMAGASAMPSASIPIQKAASKELPVQAQEISQTKRRASEAKAANAKSTAAQASPGGAGGSALRKNRKKKLPPSTEKSPELAEFDAVGKRIYAKKEHNFRLFEVIRFRALKSGDFVAARVSSRDLWILARVQRDFPGFSMPPSDFLKLSEARRDGHFREKVAIKDVEDSGSGGINMVPRNLVLPLPRTFSEAAEWCQRYVYG